MPRQGAQQHREHLPLPASKGNLPAAEDEAGNLPRQAMEPLTGHAQVGADAAGGKEGVPQPGQLSVPRLRLRPVPAQPESAAVVAGG